MRQLVLLYKPWWCQRFLWHQLALASC